MCIKKFGFFVRLSTWILLDRATRTGCKVQLQEFFSEYKEEQL